MNKKGKTKLSVLIISLLIVSFSLYFVLAATENTKGYEPSTRTLTVKNSVEEVAKIKLNTPQVYNVIRGKDRLVAEFTIVNYADASSVFNNLEFYDVKNNMKPFSREFNYKYKTYYNIEVSDYETVCKERLSINGSIEKYDCVQNQIGTHTEQRIKWNDFNEKAILPKGNITLGIFTDVYPNENVEWIPTMFGLKIDEWAEWTESFNVNLTHYWNFDDMSNATTIVDVVGTGSNQINFTGYGGVNHAANGLIGNGSSFNGLNGKYNTSVYSNMPNSNGTWSYSIWWRPNNTKYHYLLSSDSDKWKLATDNTNVYYIVFGGNNNLGAGSVAGVNKWQHIVLVRNSTTITSYVNGSLFAQTTSLFAFNNVSVIMGTYGGSTDWLNGTIDEFGVWNRNLSSAEITDLYNGGAGITYIGVFDIIPPNTTQPVITPSTPRSNQNLQCNATLTDDKQTNLIAYWKWYKNNITNLTGSKANIQNGTPTLITTLSAGNTTKGENWICEVKPYDGYNYGEALNSSSVTILNSPPTQSQPLLSTLSGKNLSTEDLTCYNKSTYDSDNDVVTNIYNWYKNNQPLLVLNMPFEGGSNSTYTKDYSNYDNEGKVIGATWNPTAGKIGGAYEFDGIDNTVSIDLPNFPETAFTFELWFNAKEFANNGRDLFTKYSANDGFRTLITSSGQIESAWDIGDTFNTLTATGITVDTWHHLVVIYNGSLLTLYLNGDLKDSKISSGNLTTGTNTLTLGFNDLATPNFNGSIDEVRIYNHALTPQQISANYNLEYNKVVSQETTAGDNYMCQVTPNDGEEDGASLNSSSLNVLWSITFNVTSGEDGSQLTNFNIYCSNNWGVTNVNSPYTTSFITGVYECDFTREGFFDRTIIFTTDNDKTVNVKMSMSGQLTFEEHTMLEWLYNCFKDGDCKALLENINKTTTQIWQRLTGTDRSVINQENVLSYTLSDTSNISINYTINVPYKEGVPINELLPIRLYFWFTNPERTTCYNQDKATDTNRAEAPYCLPLVAETLGPNNGTVTFQVDLRPALTTGTYNFTRSIEIDPIGVWTQYGREDLGKIEVLEDNNKADINLKERAKSFFENTGITGAIIGSKIFSKDNLVFLIVLLNTFILVYLIVSSKVKKK